MVEAGAPPVGSSPAHTQPTVGCDAATTREPPVKQMGDCETRAPPVRLCLANTQPGGGEGAPPVRHGWPLSAMRGATGTQPEIGGDAATPLSAMTGATRATGLTRGDTVTAVPIGVTDVGGEAGAMGAAGATGATIGSTATPAAAMTAATCAVGATIGEYLVVPSSYSCIRIHLILTLSLLILF
jgi:hypothetical protein